MGKLAAASMTSTVTRTRATRLEVVMVMVPSTLPLHLEAAHGELLLATLFRRYHRY